MKKQGQIRATAGLVLHTSNRLEILVDDLALTLAIPLPSPFTPEIVVVQSSGMRRWLEQQIAQRHGICSNIQFPFPQDFFHQRFEEAFPKAERTNFFDREIMTWRITELLSQFGARPEFAPIANYLRGERGGLRAYELARRIAHVFDQYLVFRPGMILDWDGGAGDGWQPILWRQLQSVAPAQHQAALGSRLAQALQNGAPVPERVSIFGISTLPPFYVSLIEEISTRCPLHLFLMEPTPHWFGDIRSRREKAKQRELDFGDHEKADHNLLAANSRLSRDFLNIIADLNPREFREQFERPVGETLLHVIQRDIFDLQATVSRRALGADHSLQIHSCHSIVRELEVLHDHLLALFEKDPQLKPRDIVVMMPEISLYAPFIDAVFGVPEKPEHFIPFTIADRAPRAASGVIDTWFRVLEIMPDRFGASAVLAILESPAVLRRFGIATGQLPLIQRWMDECGIRWGIDAEHRERLGFPAFAENSWRHGIDRMLLGCALQPGKRALFAGILPFDEIEGSNAMLLGNFVEFAEQLFSLAADFIKPRPLSVWSADLLSAIDDFLDADADGQLELNQLRAAVNSLADISAVLANDRAIDLEVVKAHLEYALEQTSTGVGFLSGKMTFCALKPMRSIPFKVVCLLGLNDTAYPRRDRAPSFDLIAANPKRGDRNVRDDDRALFLEALLSAREVFYLSYIGQSTRDNSTLPPSVLIGELLEYIAENFEGPIEQFTIKHPLQAFSLRNFQNDDHYFSYSADNCTAGLLAAENRGKQPVFFGAALTEPEEKWREVEIAQLINFFSSPAEFILRQRLGIELPKENEETDDREPFALHGLDRYGIEQDFLNDALERVEPESELAAIRASGVLPQGPAGDLEFGELCANVRTFAGAIAEHVSTDLQPPLNIRSSIGQFVLSGTIKRIRGETLVHYRLTSLKPKDYLRIWIEHLARNLTEPKPALLFGKDENAVASYAFPPLTNAEEIFSDLLELYWRGLREPLPLFPRTSWAFAENLANKKPEEEARKAAWKIWRGGRDEGKGEQEERYISLAFRNVAEPLGQDWAELSRLVFIPIIEARQSL